MHYPVTVSVCASLVLVALTGCAVVDRFGSRVYDHNLVSQDVMNKEVLINIVRASRYQALNFMVITQVTGSQSEMLTTGLPTITLGPAQTAVQHQFPISNTVASGFAGGYQTNPLVSSQFQEGMMSPVSPRILAFLLASHDRETVFNLAIDSINVTAGDRTVRYVNDPANNGGLAGGCTAEAALRTLSLPDQEHRFLLQEDVCNYSKFIALVTEAMQSGLSAELVPVPTDQVRRSLSGASRASTNAGAVGGEGNANATTTAEATGRLCWDPGLAAAGRKSLARRFAPRCGSNLDERSANREFYLQVLGTLRFQVRLRSPAAIFAALGKQLRDGTTGQVSAVLPASQGQFGDEPLLTVTTEEKDGCAVAAEYDGQSWCVPRHAGKTATVINILQELKNLSTTPTDLNSAFSVRVVN